MPKVSCFPSSYNGAAIPNTVNDTGLSKDKKNSMQQLNYANGCTNYPSSSSGGIFKHTFTSGDQDFMKEKKAIIFLKKQEGLKAYHLLHMLNTMEREHSDEFRMHIYNLCILNDALKKNWNYLSDFLDVLVAKNLWIDTEFKVLSADNKRFFTIAQVKTATEWSKESRKKPIVMACIQENEADFERHLTKMTIREILNFKDIKSWTLLHWAALSGNTNIFNKLLNRLVSEAFGTDTDNDTVKCEILNLLEVKATKEDKSGASMLFKYGLFNLLDNWSVACYLIKTSIPHSGAQEILQAGDHKDFPTCYIGTNGDEKTLAALEKIIGPKEIKQHHIKAILAAAVSAGNEKFINYMVKKFDLNIEDKNIFYACLLRAANSGRPDLLEKFLDAGHDVAKKDIRGWNIFHYLASDCQLANNIDLLKLKALLRNITELDSIINEKSAPDSNDFCLKISGPKDDGKILWFVVELKDRFKLAKCLKITDMRETLDCSFYGKILLRGEGDEISEEANLKLQEDINNIRQKFKKRKSMSPLAIACWKKNVTMVKFLLTAGADVLAVGDEGLSIFEFAILARANTLQDVQDILKIVEYLVNSPEFHIEQKMIDFAHEYERYDIAKYLNDALNRQTGLSIK